MSLLQTSVLPGTDCRHTAPSVCNETARRLHPPLLAKVTPMSDPEPAETRIDWEVFQSVDMRVGRVTAVEEFPEARVPAWKLEIDFGPDVGSKRSSAQVKHYGRDQLEGRLVIGVVNFPPKRIGPFTSEVLVLGALDDEKGVVLLRPDDEVAPGDRIA